jgi:DnaJ-domain-containing protein 1
MEQALIEYACHVPGQARSGQDAYDACLTAALAALRSDFGRDLQRLAAKDRRRIDATCAELRIMRGRDAYVACLSDGLRAIGSNGTTTPLAAGSHGASADAAEIASATIAPPSAGAIDAQTTEVRSSGGGTWILWLTTMAVLAAAGGGAWWFRKDRAAPPALRLCRVCGADTDGHGELCGPCRHEAAEAQRRAIAERSERQRTVAEEERRAQKEIEPQAIQAAEAERARQALEREAELAREQEAARQREEETRRWQQAAAAALVPSADEQVTDPYAVLGLVPTASEAEIHFAYLEAIAKYAPDEVAHLGEELRNLYTAKAKSIQQAYETLTTPASSR